MAATQAARRAMGGLAALALLAGGGCQPATPGGSPGPSAASSPPTAVTTTQPSPSPDRAAGWRADLDTLVERMATIHPALEHSQTVAQLDRAVAELEARIPTASDDELMVGVLRIVALVSSAGCDAHTGAFVWGTGTYPVDSLPLRLWWFPDGLHVVDALPPYENLVGARIETIAGRPAADVVAAIEPIVPRDNEATVRLLMPRYVLIPQILRGLGLVEAGPVELGVSGGAAGARTVSIEPVPMADYNRWAGPYGLHLPADPAVPYLSRIDDALWWERRADGTLVVQYNRVDLITTSQLQELAAALHEPGVARVVVDTRHNYGGQVSALVPVLELLRDPAVDRAGRLFLVTGRNTFSAASLFAARLDDSTTAIVTGEPMGGCPTAYGNSGDLLLEHSGIVVSVASLLEIGVSADDRRPTIEPELAAPLTFEAWAAGRDPALEAILAYRR